MTRVPTGESEGNDGLEKVRAGSIDSGHLLLVGAGPASVWPLLTASLPGLPCDSGRAERRPAR